MSHLYAKHVSLIFLALLAVAWTATGAKAGAGKAAAQSPQTGSQAQQSQSSTPSTAASSAKSADGKDQPGDKDSSKDKKKPKKVWTEDDISKVGGTISVVGDSSSSSSSSPAKSTSSEGLNSGNSAQSSLTNNYRDQLRQLQAQLDATDKKINDLRNFKADNSSASGGINPNHGYSMTPVSDQIKQLEEKKKEIQDKIDTLIDEARKKGIDPHDLR